MRQKEKIYENLLYGSMHLEHYKLKTLQIRVLFMAFNFHVSKSHHTCRVKILGNKSSWTMPGIRDDHVRHSTLEIQLTMCCFSFTLMPFMGFMGGKI